MTTEPINSTNAIEAAAFAVIFNRPFTGKEERKLLTLKEILKSELPDFSRPVKFTWNQEAGKNPEQRIEEKGLKLQKFEPNGRVGWVLHIMEDRLVITCSAYDRWDRVWLQTDKYLQASLALIDLASLTVQACTLQYIDQFISSNATTHSLSDVFDKKTPYLTPHCRTAGNLWHVYQGWFDKKTEEEKVLNILNLGTSEDGKKIITTIDHAAHLQFSAKPKPAKKFFSDKRDYEKAFLFLHENNKTVVKSLLNQEQRKAIGL